MFQISLRVHGIFESADTNNAEAPKVSLININSTSTTTGELILGESFIGQSSGANGILAEKLTSAQISYLSKNDKQFVEGETVTFQETGITAVVSVLTSESFDISQNYKFRTGQESTFYDQGRIVIKEGKSLPSKN